jgi:hypothetical protein
MSKKVLGWSISSAHGPRRKGVRRRDERGDVPGWVLITVMSAGLVAGLWAIAGSQLSTMLSDALSSVTG